jgi:hypothetical protein
MSAIQAADEMALYLAERRAVHSDWYIIILTTIARQAAGHFSSTNEANAELLAYDNLLLSNYATMGADDVIHVRKSGSPFAIPDFTSNTFELAPYINYEASGETTAHIHLNDLGYSVVASYIAKKLKRLPI